MLRFVLLVLPAGVMGCAAPSELPSEAPQHSTVPTEADEPAALHIEHVEAGWVEHRDSPIRPWCHAVLVAPSVAITTVECTDGIAPEELVLGWGSEGSVLERDVVALLAVSEDLVAVKLETAVDLEPASLGAFAAASCDLRLPRYAPTYAYGVPARSVSAGCLEDHAVVRLETDGVSADHGAHGGAVFNARGELGGLIVAQADGDRGYRIVTVEETSAAFERALDWSAEG